MAATAPDVVPSLNYPKREGRKGWMESWMGEELRLASFMPCLHSEILTY
jgi:hypothetical protein